MGWRLLWDTMTKQSQGISPVEWLSGRTIEGNSIQASEGDHSYKITSATLKYVGRLSSHVVLCPSTYYVVVPLSGRSYTLYPVPIIPVFQSTWDTKHQEWWNEVGVHPVSFPFCRPVQYKSSDRTTLGALDHTRMTTPSPKEKYLFEYSSWFQSILFQYWIDLLNSNSFTFSHLL